MAVQESKLSERNSAQDEVNQLVARAMKAQDAFLEAEPGTGGPNRSSYGARRTR